MDGLAETRFVERLQFFSGQQLLAGDLQGIEALNRELRWLHNRSLHQPGIGNGFAVAGRKGDREVVVQPGYALDAEGRELTLLEAETQPVPPVGAEPDGQPVSFDLVVSYPSDDDLETAETREGVCLPRGAVRLRERPVFCWVRLRRDAAGTLRAVDEALAAQVQAGLRVVLARAEVLDCRLNADLSITQRRRARPPQQPLLRCDTTAVDWQVWEVEGAGEEESRSVIGIRAEVATAAAGFRLTPCYAARVSGVRPLPVKVNQGSPDEFTVRLLDGFAYVDEPTPESFQCLVPVFSLVGDLSEPVIGQVLDQLRKGWKVTWLGIED
jgi:hypothetical protein